MKVLIITHNSDDDGINNVIAELENNQAETFRFDTNQYPSQIQLNSHYINQQEVVTIQYQNQHHNFSEFDAVWYRRLHIGEELPEMLEQHKVPAIEESKLTFLGMLASWGMGKFTLDAIRDIRYADNKQLQLKIASRVGLSIPQTLFSNSPEQVQVFAAQFSAIITKMQYSFSIQSQNKEELKVYSQRWLPNELEDLDWLAYSPMIFQEYIEKAYELRIIVVGDQLFTAKIPSQDSQTGTADWRKDLDLLSSMQPYELPAPIQVKILRLMDYFRLNYGAIDMIRTPAGQYVFLELNPVGEYQWVDEMMNLEIAKALANVLTGEAWRRN